MSLESVINMLFVATACGVGITTITLALLFATCSLLVPGFYSYQALEEELMNDQMSMLIPGRSVPGVLTTSYSMIKRLAARLVAIFPNPQPRIRHVFNSTDHDSALIHALTASHCADMASVKARMETTISDFEATKAVEITRRVNLKVSEFLRERDQAFAQLRKSAEKAQVESDQIRRELATERTTSNKRRLECVRAIHNAQTHETILKKTNMSSKGQIIMLERHILTERKNFEKEMKASKARICELEHEVKVRDRRSEEKEASSQKVLKGVKGYYEGRLAEANTQIEDMENELEELRKLRSAPPLPPPPPMPLHPTTAAVSTRSLALLEQQKEDAETGRDEALKEVREKDETITNLRELIQLKEDARAQRDDAVKELHKSEVTIKGLRKRLQQKEDARTQRDDAVDELHKKEVIIKGLRRRLQQKEDAELRKDNALKEVCKMELDISNLQKRIRDLEETVEVRTEEKEILCRDLTNLRSSHDRERCARLQLEDSIKENNATAKAEQDRMQHIIDTLTSDLASRECQRPDDLPTLGTTDSAPIQSSSAPIPLPGLYYGSNMTNSPSIPAQILQDPTNTASEIPALPTVGLPVSGTSSPLSSPPSSSHGWDDEAEAFLKAEMANLDANQPSGSTHMLIGPFTNDDFEPATPEQIARRPKAAIRGRRTGRAIQGLPLGSRNPGPQAPGNPSQGAPQAGQDILDSLIDPSLSIANPFGESKTDDKSTGIFANHGFDINFPLPGLGDPSSEAPLNPFASTATGAAFSSTESAQCTPADDPLGSTDNLARKAAAAAAELQELFGGGNYMGGSTGPSNFAQDNQAGNKDDDNVTWEDCWPQKDDKEEGKL